MAQTNLSDLVELKPDTTISLTAEDIFVASNAIRSVSFQLENKLMHEFMVAISQHKQTIIPDSVDEKSIKLVNWLIAAGFLQNTDGLENKEDLLSDTLRLYHRTIDKSIPDLGIEIDGSGIIAERLRELLPHEEKSRGKVITVVARDVEDTSSILEANEKYLLQSHKILFVSLYGPRIRIGPLTVPGQSACYACFLKRLDLSAENPDLVRYSQTNTYSLSRHRQISNIAANIAASISAAIVIRESSSADKNFLLNNFIQISAVDMSSHSATVLKVPRCSACGRSQLSRTDRVRSSHG